MNKLKALLIVNIKLKGHHSKQQLFNKEKDFVITKKLCFFINSLN